MRHPCFTPLPASVPLICTRPWQTRETNPVQASGLVNGKGFCPRQAVRSFSRARFVSVPEWIALRFCYRLAVGYYGNEKKRPGQKAMGKPPWVVQNGKGGKGRPMYNTDTARGGPGIQEHGLPWAAVAKTSNTGLPSQTWTTALKSFAMHATSRIPVGSQGSPPGTTFFAKSWSPSIRQTAQRGPPL